MEKSFIPFNKPYLSGKELDYISQAVASGKISGDGLFTKQCKTFFAEHFGFSNNLLTTSCTDALEMAAILLRIEPGDEVIVPSYTFVSTVNAFVLRGAELVFADSLADHPNIDEDVIEDLITERTKAIVIVHYGGVACNMDRILSVAEKYNVAVIEDAAQAIDSYYKGSPLGSFGVMSTFSFHETKNVISGEGGLLVVNDDDLYQRAEIIREKGTNRSAFFRGEVDKYNWVDVGSSFLPSDIIAAFLYAQLEQLDTIQQKRKKIWEQYYEELKDLESEGKISFLPVPHFATNNAHLFAITCSSIQERTALVSELKKENVLAVFHYLSLHKSPFYKDRYNGPALPMADKFSDTLLRLPLFYELSEEDVSRVTSTIRKFYTK